MRPWDTLKLVFQRFLSVLRSLCAGNLSASVKVNLTMMRDILAKSPTMNGSFDVLPFINAVDESSRSGN